MCSPLTPELMNERTGIEGVVGVVVLLPFLHHFFVFSSVAGEREGDEGERNRVEGEKQRERAHYTMFLRRSSGGRRRQLYTP